MFTFDEKTKLISFPKIEGLGYDSLETLVCEDPYCNCGNGNLLVIDKKNEKNLTPENAVLIGVNYGQNTLVYDDKMKISEEAKENTKQAISFFEENMTTGDWAILSTLAIYQKMMSIEFMPHDEHFKYEFSKEQEQDMNLKISFEEIYPACERLGFTDANGDLYEIVDVHCKKPTCKCQDLHIQVYKNATFIYELEYNYGQKVITGGIDKESVLIGIKRKYPKLDMRLAKRNELIRSVTRKAIKGTSGNSLPKATKIGRNEPCPCGSGKKYKKCCLTKYKQAV